MAISQEIKKFEQFIIKNNLDQFLEIIKCWKDYIEQIKTFSNYIDKITSVELELICLKFQIDYDQIPENLIEDICEYLNNLIGMIKKNYI